MASYTTLDKEKPRCQVNKSNWQRLRSSGRSEGSVKELRAMKNKKIGIRSYQQLYKCNPVYVWRRCFISMHIYISCNNMWKVSTGPHCTTHGSERENECVTISTNAISILLTIFTQQNCWMPASKNCIRAVDTFVEKHRKSRRHLWTFLWPAQGRIHGSRLGRWLPLKLPK